MKNKKLPNGGMGESWVRCLLFLTGVLLLIVGILFYLIFRAEHLPPVLVWLVERFPELQFSGVVQLPLIHAALPSFIHVIAWSLISLSFVPHTRKFIIAVQLFWFVVNLVSEFLYWQGNVGELHVEDIVASVIAVLLLVSLGLRYLTISKRSHEGDFRPNRRVLTLVFALVFCGGIISISGSYTCEENDNCFVIHRDAEPVYMSYEELRSAVAVNTERKLEKTGKIYTYNDFLLISEPNQGVHVYDNSDEQNPLHLGFIVVPGNQDIAINHGFLYVDSFIDLVTIDLRDKNNIHEVHRVENIFPYDPYQAIDDPNVYLSNYDQEKGVIIGYTESTEGNQ